MLPVQPTLSSVPPFTCPLTLCLVRTVYRDLQVGPDVSRAPLSTARVQGQPTEGLRDDYSYQVPALCRGAAALIH